MTTLGAAALLSLAVVACGSSGEVQSLRAAPAATPSGSEVDEAKIQIKPVVISTGSSSIGTVLTDSRGMTLYVFSGDRPNASRCSRVCAHTWWPVLARGDKPQAAVGVGLALVGSTQRDDGSDQVTFRGAPLYYSPRDMHAGDVAGNGSLAFGGSWTAARPAKSGK